ncbi:MAG: periplasmic heavy metal sensor [Rhodospirillales bacterium]|nr:periplasmic heavy metal sensor [Rhodospirillales bacterium]QQS13246.1 MAG: periplasmic heavy metal sensor [Rhodospirillales bacterium]
MRRHLAWILLGLSVVLNVFFIGGFVQARYFGGPPQVFAREPGERRGPQQVDVPERLNLNATEARGFRDAMRQLRERNVGKARELLQLRERLLTEMRKEKPDFAAVDAMLDRAAVLRSDLQKDGLRTSDKVAASFRPEQRDRFMQFVIARTLNPGGPGGARPMERRGPAGRQGPEERRP